MNQILKYIILSIYNISILAFIIFSCLTNTNTGISLLLSRLFFHLFDF